MSQLLSPTQSFVLVDLASNLISDQHSESTRTILNRVLTLIYIPEAHAGRNPTKYHAEQEGDRFAGQEGTRLEQRTDPPASNFPLFLIFSL